MRACNDVVGLTIPPVESTARAQPRYAAFKTGPENRRQRMP